MPSLAKAPVAKLEPAKMLVPPVAADLAALPAPDAAAAPVVSTPSPKPDAAPLQQAEDGAVELQWKRVQESTKMARGSSFFGLFTTVRITFFGLRCRGTIRLARWQ